MNLLSKSLLLMALMLAASVSAVALRPSHKLADSGPRVDLEAMIPKSFGDWRIDDSLVPVLPAPDVQAKLDLIYNQVLVRTYINSRREGVMLSIAYGGDQSDGLQAHFPEGCYTGQGFAVGEVVKGTLMKTPTSALPVARMVASKGFRNEPITYWIASGNQVAVSAWEMKKIKLRYALRGEIPDGMLIRISSISTDVQGAYRLQESFAADMLAAVSPDVRARISGG